MSSVSPKIVHTSVQMKNILFALALSPTCLLAGVHDDALISFSTKGPDLYSDGSVVADGEVYALVWSKDGVFEGFSADGKPLDSEDKIVLAASLAKGGRCPSVLFQIPANLASDLSPGKYAVYLLDTRVVVDGKSRPKGLADGKVGLLNASGAVSSSLSVEKSSSAVADILGSIAHLPASAPSGLAQPKIKAIEVGAENVFITVENLKGFMRVGAGGGVGGISSTGAAFETSGSEEDVVLVAPKQGASGFYKVIRN